MGDRRPPRDVILIGASAGGIEALTHLLSEMEPDIPAAIGITLHRGAFPGRLKEVLDRHARIRVYDARDGASFQQGRVLVAPADRHMLFEGETIRLDRGPKQHHTRPAIDPMLRSGAEAFGRRVVGIVLTGNLSDGVTGLVQVKQHGGISVVQDPDEAPFPSMPESALRYDHVDVVSRIDRMPRLLSALARGAPVLSAVVAAQRSGPATTRGGRTS